MFGVVYRYIRPIRILEDDNVRIWFGLGKVRETRVLSHRLVIFKHDKNQTKPRKII